MRTQPKGELVLRDVHSVNGPAGALCVIRFKTLNAARLAARLLQRDDPKLCAYARHVAPSPLTLRLGAAMKTVPMVRRFDCGDAHDQGVIDSLTRGPS